MARTSLSAIPPDLGVSSASTRWGAPPCGAPGSPPPGTSDFATPAGKPMAPGSVQLAVTSTGVPEPSASPRRSRAPGSATSARLGSRRSTARADQSSSAAIRPVSDQFWASGGGLAVRAQQAAVELNACQAASRRPRPPLGTRVAPSGEDPTPYNEALLAERAGPTPRYLHARERAHPCRR